MARCRRRLLVRLTTRTQLKLAHGLLGLSYTRSSQLFSFLLSGNIISLEVGHCCDLGYGNFELLFLYHGLEPLALLYQVLVVAPTTNNG